MATNASAAHPFGIDAFIYGFCFIYIQCVHEETRCDNLYARLHPTVIGLLIWQQQILLVE